MYIGLHVKYTRYSCQILMELEFPRQIFEKYSNIKFHENPFSGSRVVLCWRTDMTKLIVAFPNFANAPRNQRDVLYDFCSFRAFDYWYLLRSWERICVWKWIPMFMIVLSVSVVQEYQDSTVCILQVDLWTETGLSFIELSQIVRLMPIPVAARSKAWVFGRSLAGIVGSNCRSQ